MPTSPTPLTNKLAALRRKVRWIRLLTGSGRVVVVIAALTAGSYLLDRALRLPFGVRTVLLLGVVMVVALVIRRLLLVPLRVTLDDQALAAGVEAAHPDLRDRVRSAIDFERAIRSGELVESRAMAERVVAETEADVLALDFRRVARGRRIVPWVGAAMAAVVGLTIGLSLGGSHTGVWFKRCVLLDRGAVWPRTTVLRVLMPPKGSPVYVTEEDGRTVFNVAQGLDFTVNVVADRGDPPEVALHFDPLADDERRLGGTRVLPRVQRGRYATTFERLTRSFAFHVEGGDDSDADPRYAVRIHHAPAVAAIRVAAEFPAYTLRAPRIFESGDVEVPRDTRLTITIESTSPLLSAVLVVEGEAPRPLTRTTDVLFGIEITATRDFDYAFEMVGRNRIQNHDRVHFRVLTVPDRAPSIAMLRPQGALAEAAPGGVVALLARVSDDHEVAATRLVLGREKTRRSVKLGDDDRIDDPRSSGAPTRAFHVFRHLEVEGLGPTGGPPPTPGDVIRLAIEADDNHQAANGDARPNTGRTKEVRVEILRKSDLERRVNDSQLRVKESVRRALAYQERTLTEANDLIAALEKAAKVVDLAEMGEQILTVERRQNRISADARNALNEIRANLDTYVYNRLSNAPMNIRILGIFARESRRAPEDELARPRALVDALGAETEGSTEVLGKLVHMVALALEVAQQQSPAAARALGKARGAADAAAVVAGLRRAVDTQTKARAGLAALLAGLEDWEDYQEVIQLNKELIELQSEIGSRTINLIKKRSQ